MLHKKMAIELFMKSKRARVTAPPSSESRRSSNDFRTVKNAEDCVDALLKAGLITRTGVLTTSLPAIEQICNAMRKDGLGLEPNLLSRAVIDKMSSHRGAGEAAMLLAGKDGDFLRLADQADRNRDLGNIEDAQYNYWRALKLYPSHHAYVVQYAHCLKDRGLLEDAFINYVDAVQFGAALADVVPHAEFVAERANLGSIAHLFHGRSSLSPNQSAAQRELTSRDIRTTVLAFHLEDPPVKKIVSYLCKCSNREALMQILMGEPRFLTAHRDLLLLLKETTGEAK